MVVKFAELQVRRSFENISNIIFLVFNKNYAVTSH